MINLNKLLSSCVIGTPKKLKTYILLYKGQPIQFPNRKNRWKAINHAKCALTNFIECHYYALMKIDDRLKTSSKDISKELIDSGVIEVKELIYE